MQPIENEIEEKHTQYYSNNKHRPKSTTRKNEYKFSEKKTHP